MKVFIAHSIGMTQEAIQYARQLTSVGHECYIPGRDTCQTTNEMQILKTNRDALEDSDEVHVIWDLSSLGTIFDLGVAFAFQKPVRIISTKKFHWTKFIARNEGMYLWK